MSHLKNFQSYGAPTHRYTLVRCSWEVFVVRHLSWRTCTLKEINFSPFLAFFNSNIWINFATFWLHKNDIFWVSNVHNYLGSKLKYTLPKSLRKNLNLLSAAAPPSMYMHIWPFFVDRLIKIEMKLNFVLIFSKYCNWNFRWS